MPNLLEHFSIFLPQVFECHVTILVGNMEKKKMIERLLCLYMQVLSALGDSISLGTRFFEGLVPRLGFNWLRIDATLELVSPLLPFYNGLS